MTNAQLKALLLSLGLAGVLLIIGFLLRSKIKVLQKIFLPASIVGGLVGLILGPYVLGLLFPAASDATGVASTLLSTYENTYTTWSNLAGVLIIPIFAATPLGKFSKKAEKGETKEKGKITVPVCVFLIMTGILFFQILIGLLVNVVGEGVFGFETYKLFGFELSTGFVGGHGTAATLGSMYAGLAASYPEDAAVQTMAANGQSVAMVFATIGLVLGMVLGIVFINLASRKGLLANKNIAGLNEADIKGYSTDVEAQPSLGRDTTKNYAIESVSFTLAIIFAVSWLSYFIIQLLGTIGSLIGSIAWSLALILMYGVNFLLQKLHLEWLVDKRVVGHLQGLLTDFAIVTAVASINISLVAAYIVPIIIASVIGLIATFFYVFGLTKLACGENYSFEHSIIAWGAATGVLITGLMLLKICDPDYSTPAQKNFAAGFAVMSLVQGIFLTVIATMIPKLNNAFFIILGLAVTVVCTAAILVIYFIRKKNNKKVEA